MSEIQRYYAGVEVSRPARRAGEAISARHFEAAVRVSAADASTDIALAKVENVTTATGTAMSAVVRIAQAQRSLEQLAPEASGRLAHLADDHLLGMSELLADLRYNLRRK